MSEELSYELKLLFWFIFIIAGVGLMFGYEAAIAIFGLVMFIGTVVSHHNKKA